MTAVRTGGFVAVTPAPLDEWRRLHAADPLALPSQAPEWVTALRRAGGHTDASRLYRFTDGTQVVLPAVRGRVLPAALARHASMPAAWGFGGLVGPEKGSPEVIRAVLDDLAGQRAVQWHVRPDPLRAAEWEIAAPEGWLRLPRRAHVLDLRGGFEQVWTGFRPSARRNARKAEKAGVTVRCDHSRTSLEALHGLLVASFDRWARQQHEPRLLVQLRGRLRDPRRKFAAVAAALGDRCRVYTAWLDGQAIAADLVLLGANAHNTRGAMDREQAGRVGATALLQRAAIEDACRAGCRAYHMGESGDSANLARFKEQFGARPHAYHEYRHERLPLTAVDRAARDAVKRLVRFRDP